MLLLITAFRAVAQVPAPVFPQPLSPRIANYQIDVSLDPATKKLAGRETLTWRNTSSDVIGELRFHLYLNAFRNDKSQFMREAGGQLRGNEIDRNATDNPYGFIDVTSMKRRGGKALSWQFIQPDNPGNRDDRTVIR
ncbi:M1 family metallopeptidase, partial [Escherichia coli]|nr:M1 family metallopeptidase [Escherichia coli]